MYKRQVESLEQKLLESSPASEEQETETEVAESPSGGETETTETGPRKIDMPEPEPVDLHDTAGAPLFKRFGPFALVALVLVLLRRRKR